MAAYNDVEHSSACQDNHKYIVTIQAEMDAYRRKWPHHCGECKGVGWLWEQGDDSVGMPGYWYICPECVLKGFCPRCGEILDYTAIDEDFDLEGERVVCSECGVVIGHDEQSLGALEDQLIGLSDCTCADEQYARWQAEHPATRYEEGRELGMTEEEAHAYEQTGDLPNSYLERSDRYYDMWRERRTWGR